MLSVTTLTLTHYRNFSSLKLHAEGKALVALVGDNGVGKTNVLEALSFLAPGRGLRGDHLMEIDTIGGHESWTVAAQISTPQRTWTLGTGHRMGRRVVKVDGDPIKSPKVGLGGMLPVMWLVPQMDHMFLDSASERRRFLDQMVEGLDPLHTQRCRRYKRALKARSALLKSGRSDHLWLAGLEKQIAAWGVAIAAARRDMIARLNKDHFPGPFPSADVALKDDIASLLESLPALEVEEHFQKTLFESRALGRESGITPGPHRADLLAWNRGTASSFCSTGEQKALVLSIILSWSHIYTLDKGHPPLLLLDEATTRLDAKKRRSLFQALSSLGTQTWITGTDPSDFDTVADNALIVHLPLQDPCHTIKRT